MFSLRKILDREKMSTIIYANTAPLTFYLAGGHVDIPTTYFRSTGFYRIRAVGKMPFNNTSLTFSWGSQAAPLGPYGVAVSPSGQDMYFEYEADMCVGSVISQRQNLRLYCNDDLLANLGSSTSVPNTAEPTLTLKIANVGVTQFSQSMTVSSLVVEQF